MDIDFVVLWVDGNDPQWQAQKAKYQGKTLDDSNAAHRFRDWGLMPYWFRAVEKFCPWVRKVHFVLRSCAPVAESGLPQAEPCEAQRLYSGRISAHLQRQYH